MKGQMSEAVKNFFVCAALMLVCGICFLTVLGKTTMGIVCIGVAVVLVIMAFAMASKEKDKHQGSGENTHKEKQE